MEYCTCVHSENIVCVQVSVYKCGTSILTGIYYGKKLFKLTLFINFFSPIIFFFESNTRLELKEELLRINIKKFQQGFYGYQKQYCA